MDEKETIEMLEILVENAKQMQDAVRKVNESAETTRTVARGLNSTLRNGVARHCMMQNVNDQNTLKRIMSEAVAGKLDREVDRVESLIADVRRVLRLTAVATAVIAALAVLTICFSAAAMAGSLQDGFWRICSGIGVTVVIVIVVAVFISTH